MVAPDHLGFGLSEKPADAPYRPEDHARRLEALLEHFGLEGITLVVHDFGGPIGLSYAVRHPERVRRLVLFNTWMWSLAGGRSVERASQILGGPVGRFLYTRLNFSPRVLFPALTADRSRLSREAHRHYTDAFPSAKERVAPWVFARELLDSAEWYDSLWGRRDRLREIPTLLVWGMRDRAFGPAVLERWREALPGARVARVEGAGRLVQEEEGEALVPVLEGFLSGSERSRGEA